MRIFRSDKMATNGVSRTMHAGSTLALQRSIFRENCTNILTFIARKVGSIVCETKKNWRSEMLTDPTTVTLAAHARRGQCHFQLQIIKTK